MNKLAVFVEGQTEQIFVKKLVKEIAGEKNIEIRLEKSIGGKNVPRRIQVIEAETPNTSAKYYIQIVDCSSDSRVASEIRDQYESLTKNGFHAIIGLRDVYPMARTALSKIQQGMKYRLKTRPIVVDLVLAVMEIEAWFLAEHTHFARIGNGITLAAIKSAIGFDPSADDMEDRDHPAADLDQIYRLGGQSYSKKKSMVQATVDVLDYAQLYMDLGARMGSLRSLTEALDRFLGA